MEAAQLLDEARRAWPQLSLDAAAFAAFAAERPDATAPAADLALAFACGRGDPAALALFEERLIARLDAVLARTLDDASLRDEAKQRVRAKVLVGDGGPPRIAGYSGRGDLFSWLAVVATREAVSLARARSAPPVDELHALLGGAGVEVDPHLAYTKKLYRAEFEQAFREALEAIDAKDRAVLRHQLVERLSLEEIGALYRIHPVSAARRVTRARSELLSATRRALTRRLQLVGDELDSVLRLVRSQVDLSLGRLGAAAAKKDR